MKRQITKSQLSFVSKELELYESNGLITQEQKNGILDTYELKNKFNFIRVVVTIGAVLVGLGILSFIASNWDGINNLLKLILIFGVFTGTNLSGYLLTKNYPKTARSLHYLAILVYGAGIFLIGQMYNFGGSFAAAFLLWSLGTLPMALHLNDKFLMLFANILFAAYLNGSWNQDFPIAGWIGLPVIYLAAVWNFEKSKLLLFFANFTALNFILLIGLYNEVKGIYMALIFFVIGLLMYGVKHNLKHEVFKIQGNLLFGIAGVILTIPNLWDGLVSIQWARLTSVLFALAFMVLLFFLIRKGSIVSLIFVCITIFRYYMDTFAFLPKSLFFIVGGLLLLGFGYYFERLRRASKGGIAA